MRRSFSFLLFFFAVLLSIKAQIVEPVHFRVEKRIVGENELEIIFKATIDEGWHVYGPDNSDNGPIPAVITFETREGVFIKNDSLEVRSTVQRKHDEMFNSEVSYLENEATFVKHITVMDNKYNVSGYLTYGACNDENCIPPTRVEFSFSGEGTLASATTAATTDTDSGWWTPVMDELRAFDQADTYSETSLGWVFFLGILGGFLALLTPCVWPIIPMTVSFFLKRSKDRRQGIRDAVSYGISIVVIYLLLGLSVTLLFGASALNALSTNAIVNLFFFAMLVVFAASFLGGFDISLPSKWTNAVDRTSERVSGLLSIFLMAFTLSLVSFSCTGPIIGFLLVEVSATGNLLAPAIGMLGFALALALPFSLFALFPAWLKSAPKSGGWMNRVKVCLGFLELAFALKFFSVADLAYGWHMLDREVFLSLWIVLFALLGAYLIGWIRFPHDEDEYDEMGSPIVNPRTSVSRFFLGFLSLAFALYMVPGLWGAPCKAVSAFAPPMHTQDFNLNATTAGAHFYDFDQGMAYAQQKGMPVLVDFTGYGCVNCRKMEAAVWTDTRVAELMNEQYVVITLYVDDKTALPTPIEVEENGNTVKLRTIGDRWSYLQRNKFGANAQPFYVLLNTAGHPLTGAYSFDEDPDHFLSFLQKGLDAFNR